MIASTYVIWTGKDIITLGVLGALVIGVLGYATVEYIKEKWRGRK